MVVTGVNISSEFQQHFLLSTKWLAYNGPGFRLVQNSTRSPHLYIYITPSNDGVVLARTFCPFKKNTLKLKELQKTCLAYYYYFVMCLQLD